MVLYRAGRGRAAYFSYGRGGASIPYVRQAIDIFCYPFLLFNIFLKGGVSWESLTHFDGLYKTSNCYFFSFEKWGNLWCTSAAYTIVVPNGHRTKVIWGAILFSRFKQTLKEIMIWHLLEGFFCNYFGDKFSCPYEKKRQMNFSSCQKEVGLLIFSKLFCRAKGLLLYISCLSP